MKPFYYLFVSLTGLLLSCDPSSPSPDGSTPTKNGVAIYLISSPIDLSTNATALDKAQLTLSTESLISYEEIKSYAADAHILKVQPAAIDRLKELSGNIPLSGKPFAVVVDGNVVYTGLLWNPISSFSAAYPFIVLDKTEINGTSAFAQGELKIEFRTPPPGGATRADLRNDSRLLDRLKQDNKLN